MPSLDTSNNGFPKVDRIHADADSAVRPFIDGGTRFRTCLFPSGTLTNAGRSKWYVPCIEEFCTNHPTKRATVD